jgi:hypothetical protein
MDKRYQVFVSSTFADLKDERARVIQTLMEMDCIPAGMELFPAADEDQLAFIKRVIDDCDYYVVIVGGRYGTMNADGVSYTEREYEYALERGLKVIALLHEDPEALPMGKSEGDPVIRERLKGFRDRLADGRLVKFWTKSDDLPGLVALSLAKAIKMFPAVGWIRASQQPREELLEEITDLRRQNERLNVELRAAKAATTPPVADLAGLDDLVSVVGKCRVGSSQYRRDKDWSLEISWREMFSLLAPFLMDSLNEVRVASQMAHDLFEKVNTDGENPSINTQAFQTIKVQLLALRLVEARYAKTTQGGYATFWSLTERGRTLMFETRTLRKKSDAG